MVHASPILHGRMCFSKSRSSKWINPFERIEEERTVLMLVNEISKLFDGLMSKCPENIFFNEKTPRLIIMMLSLSDGLTQSELVELTHMKGSTVSVAITKLEGLGYVKRVENPYDMRSVRVYLTSKGRDFDETMRKILTDKDEMIMTGISPKEIRITLTVLNQMLDNIKKKKEL